MLIFPPENHKKFGILFIVNSFIWILIILALIAASWLFLFVYNHLYSAMVQKTAIINLRSQFIIAKVDKQGFDNLIKEIEAKRKPISTINFKNVGNPFVASR
jgi:hypothetical protein